MKSAKVPQAPSPSLVVTEICYIQLVLGVSVFDRHVVISSPAPPQSFTDCPISMADQTLYKNVAGGDELCHFHFSAEKYSSLCVPVTKLGKLGLLYFFSPELS